MCIHDISTPIDDISTRLWNFVPIYPIQCTSTTSTSIYVCICPSSFRTTSASLGHSGRPTNLAYSHLSIHLHPHRPSTTPSHRQTDIPHPFLPPPSSTFHCPRRAPSKRHVAPPSARAPRPERMNDGRWWAERGTGQWLDHDGGGAGVRVVRMAR
jgi:hypothetical protein